ncbi:MAG: tRNA methyltransferase [Candidatus Aramenus sp.]|nr:tRNA methyltransferase [Candidatus Aramenus sp.]
MYVLRLGHRPSRDKRVTTHVVLVARAFGARGVFIEGEDPKLLDSVNKVKELWGGRDFKVEFTTSSKELVRSWKEKGGKVVHLTMYGINISSIPRELIEGLDNLLIIVGAEKVEGWYYKEADYNIAIGNQPHSEVAALAIFLDRVYKGEELNVLFEDSKLLIIPQEAGKKVIRVDRR